MKDDANPKPYHHGDLRAALLLAGEVELAERGIEAFSLRAVAKRAGVSHAAPAHHFNDAKGLLTALAAEGYQRLLAAQARREGAADADARAQLVASGLGYVDFAMARPALFRLIFGSVRADYSNEALYKAAERAFQHLEELVAAAGGKGPADVQAVWAAAHGLADLLAAGRMTKLMGMGPGARDAQIVAIIARALPVGA
jgi:AcrR family transcriptional regulator